MESRSLRTDTEYRARFARFDQKWSGLLWLLARNPEPIGSSYRTTVGGTEYLLCGIDGDFAANLPEVWMAYTYSEETLFIHDVYAEGATPDEQGEE
jgi:hypothetical protein